MWPATRRWDGLAVRGHFRIPGTSDRLPSGGLGLGEKKGLTAERTRRSALLSRVSARDSLERRFSSFLRSVTTSRLTVELHVCIRSSSRRASLDNATSRGSAFSCENWVTAPALGSYCEDYTSNSTYVANASKAAMDALGRGLSDGARRSHDVQNLHSHRRQLGETHSKRATTAPAVLVRRQTPAMRVEQTRSRRGKVATARGAGGEPKVSGAQPNCGPGAEGRNPGLPGGAAEPSTRTGQERVVLPPGCLLLTAPQERSGVGCFPGSSRALTDKDSAELGSCDALAHGGNRTQKVTLLSPGSQG